MATKSIYKVQTDGGSRGNPGPAASGYVITGSDIGKIEHGEYLGTATNNVAEYTAVILALKQLKETLGKKAKEAIVEVYADSELLVKQVNGQYRVKNTDLKVLFQDLWTIQLDFAKVSFYHVRREHNKEADRMVNWALDRATH